MEHREYTVEAARLDEFAAKEAKLAKKAAAIGAEPPAIVETGEPFAETFETPNGMLEKLLVVVKVSPPEVALPGGWTVKGAVDFTDAGDAVARSRGHDMAAYTDAGPTCDHCGKARQRKTCYVVGSENGDEKLIGSTCMALYTGLSVPASSINTYCDDWDDLGAWAEEGRDRPNEKSTREFAAFCAMAIRMDGWVSVAAAEGALTSTCLTAETAMRDIGGPRPEAADYKEADEAIGWARNLTPATVYESNLRAIAKSELHDDKHAGLLASVFIAKRNAENAEKRRYGGDAPYVGKTGEKVEIKATVDRILRVMTRFGEKRLVQMVDPEGREMVWWTGADPKVGEGDACVVRGTVKERGEFRGTPQTTLTRCKLEAA